MSSTRLSRRDTLITILLIVAGIALALTLFGAGALWKGRTNPRSTVGSISNGGESPR